MPLHAVRSAWESGRRPSSELDVDPGQRRVDPLRPLEAGRRERHDLVLSGGGLDEAAERAADVVADPERGVR